MRAFISKMFIVSLAYVWIMALPLQAEAGIVVEWEKTFDNRIANSVVGTSDGAMVVAGAADTDDFWLAKLDARGNLVWEVTDTSSNGASQVIETSDGGLAAVTYGGDVIKLDAQGGELWKNGFLSTLSGCYECRTSITETADGGLAASSTDSFYDGSYYYCNGDSFLAKFDSEGNGLWEKSLDFCAESIAGTSDGGIVLAGGEVEEFHSSSDSDPFLMKIGADEEILWENTGYHGDALTSVIEIADGELAMTMASFPGEGRLIIADANGESMSDEYWWYLPYSIIETADAGLAAIGSFFSDGDMNVAIGKTEPYRDWQDVSWQWYETFGEAGVDDRASSVTQISDGGLVIAGRKNWEQTWIMKLMEPGKIHLDMDISTTDYDNPTHIESELPACKDSEIWIAVAATDVINLDTYQVEVSFDTTRLQFMEGAEDNPLGGIYNLLKKNGGKTTGFLAVEDTPGTVNISNTLTGEDCDQAPEGSGLLALLKFKVLTTGSDAELTLGNAFFIDCAGNNASVSDLENGKFILQSNLPSDFNADGVVDFIDLGLLANHWLLECGDDAWNAKYDLEEDCIVNYQDLRIFGDNWLNQGGNCPISR